MLSVLRRTEVSMLLPPAEPAPNAVNPASIIATVTNSRRLSVQHELFWDALLPYTVIRSSPERKSLRRSSLSHALVPGRSSGFLDLHGSFLYEKCCVDYVIACKNHGLGTCRRGSALRKREHGVGHAANALASPQLRSFFLLNLLIFPTLKLLHLA